MRTKKLRRFLLLFIAASLIFFFLRIKDQESKVRYRAVAGEEKVDDSATGESGAEAPEKETSTIENPTTESLTIESFSTESLTIESFSTESLTIESFSTESPAIESFSTESPTIESSTKESFTKESSATGSSSSKSEKITTKININTASVEELQTLKGIGPATAKSIILYREEYGAFSAIEEIMNVKRIGEKTFAKIKERITVE